MHCVTAMMAPVFLAKASGSPIDLQNQDYKGSPNLINLRKMRGEANRGGQRGTAVRLAIYFIFLFFAMIAHTFADGLLGSYFNEDMRGIYQNDWRINESTNLFGTVAYPNPRLDAGIQFAGDGSASWATGGNDVNRTDWQISGSNAEWNAFSVQWDGFVVIASNNTVLYTSSDDGSRAWVDMNGNGAVDTNGLDTVGAPAWNTVNNSGISNGWVNNDFVTGQGETLRPVSGPLAPGVYKLRVQYEQGYFNSVMFLCWNDGTHNNGTRNGEYIIPADHLLSIVSTPIIDNDGGASNVTASTAMLYGNLISTGSAPTAVYVFWGIADAGSNKTGWASSLALGSQGTGPVATNVTGLSGNTTYFYRYYATNQNGDAWADSSTPFTTYAESPFIQNSGAATGVTAVSAWLTGDLVSTGTAPATVYVFMGSSDAGTNKSGWATSLDLGVCGAGPVATNVSGLAGNTMYFYRYYATNMEGDAWADSSTAFTTYPQTPFVQNSGGATGVTGSSAWLMGDLVSTGTAPTTVYVFWGTTDCGTNMAYWASANNLGILNPGQFTAHLAGLTNPIVYYYRFYATNAFGGAWSEATEQFLSINAFMPPSGQIDTRQLWPCSRMTPLTISEIMYNPPKTYTNDTEFIELYNTDPIDHDISGYRLSGDISFTFPTGTTIRARSYLVVGTDPVFLGYFYGLNNVLGPYSGKLPNESGTINLNNSHGASLLNVQYSSAYPWPAAADGSGHSLVLTKPDYGEGDVRAWSASAGIWGNPGTNNVALTNTLTQVVINEFLAHTDPPEVDSIELFNNSTTAVDISGCYLSDDPTTNKFRIPNGTILTPRGFAVFYYGTDFNFLLSPHAAAIYLVDPTQSYVIDAILYPAQVNGVSYGRYPDGAPGFQTLSSWTPGTSNSVPYQSDIVINEIMYAPMSGLDDDQYIELYNRGTGTVDMSYWRFTSGIDFMIPPGTLIASNGYVVVAKNATNLFTKYPNLNTANTVGDYSGKLSGGGRLALSRPDNINLPYQDFVDVDDVTYNAGWGQWSDAGGSSLELIDPHSDNRLAMNWADSDETHKAGWTTIDYTGSVDNGMGPPDAFRVYFLNAGECLLDNVQMATPGGTTYLPLQTFESGLGNWQFWGDHVRSGLETTGYLSSASLHIRASDTGANGWILTQHSPPVDPYLNNVSFPLSTYPSTNSPATNVEIKAMARWLCGYPYVVLGLKGFWIEASVKLNVPANLGTPGMPNSRYKANTGPAISEVTHAPILPSNQPVVVTCRVNDPDGIASVKLNYRIDPSWTTNTVAMLDNGTGGDAIANDGIYSATIPAQSSGTIVGFTIAAVDNVAPACTNVYPRPPSTTMLAPLECLVRFGDTVPPGNFATYFMWLSQTNAFLWTSICGPTYSKYSNEPLGLTLVLGNYRAIYNCGGRWHGFWRDYDNATDSGSYNIDVPKSDRYLGKGSVFFRVPENGQVDSTFQINKTGYWITEQMGFEASPLRYVRFFANGTPRDGANGIMFDFVEPSVDLTASWYGDSDPQIYKNYGLFDGDPFGLYEDSHGSYKQSRYRWYLRKEQSDRPNDDYTGLYDLAAAFSTTNDALFTKRVQSLVDTRGWLSYFAINGALGNWDTYGLGNAHNMYAYLPVGDKARMFIFDTDWCFSFSPGVSPFPSDTTDFPIACRMCSVNQPAFRREFWNLLKDMADGPMQAANCNPVMDAWYAAFNANGVTATSPTNIEAWISQQRTYLISQMASVTSTVFTISTTNFTTSVSPVTIAGSAPVQVEKILINSNEYPVIWTATTSWHISASLTNGLNSLTFSGRDRNGNVVGTAHINVTYTGGYMSAAGNLVINEIMYNPAQLHGEFLEIYNTNSVYGFDLTGMRLDGVDFTFGGGSYIGPTSYVVVAANLAGYQAIYSNVEVVVGEYSGSLNNGGETIKLEMPLTTNTWQILDEVKFDNNPPWPAQANGGGPSLQLIDTTKDNNRVGNWAVDANTLYTPGRANSVTASLPSFDDLWINEIMPSNTATIKNNAGQYAPWLELYNSSNTVNLFSNGYYLTDSYTNLTKWAFPAGWSVTNNGYQLVWCDGETNLTASTNLHAGFMMNSSSGSVALVRKSGANAIIVDYVNYGAIGKDSSYGYYPDGTGGARQVFYYPTPGGKNNSASLPVHICINEWMAKNTSTLADPADGDFDDWFELYNADTQTVDITGFQLAGNLNTNSLNKVPDGTTIPGHGFMLVWANAAKTVTGSDLYVSFGLSKSGDKIALYAPDNTLADSVVFGAQSDDISEGRWPDGSTNIYQMPIPTPRTTNRLFTISNVGMSGTNGLSLCWNTRYGGQYRVMQTDSLTNPVWTNAFGVDMNATGGMFVTNLYFSAPVSSRYYRIKQVN